MSLLRDIARRVGFGLFTAWVVMTTVFLTFTVSENWVTGRIEARVRRATGFGGEPVPAAEVEARVEAAIAEYANPRGLDRPLFEQYLDWMGNMVTLRWGESFRTGEAVYPMVTDAALRTATYVLPAVFLAVVIGISVGVFVALYPDSKLANYGRLGSYLAFVIPSFWLGGMLVSATQGGVVDRYGLLFDHLFPALLVTMTLLGGYVSYSRAYAREQASSRFVSLVQAKGGGPGRVGRHVLRNAAVPISSLLFTQALGLTALGIFVVEVLFSIEGLGIIILRALDARDLPVLLGSTLIIILVAVVGSILQDLSYRYLDPRVDED